jgi:uncharacterized protein with PQ loop repeat
VSHLVVGWSASVVVVLTTIGQIYKQYAAHSSKGVSPLLFVGNLVAALLFLNYAIMIKNVVYEVTNAAMVLASIVGLALLLHQRRLERPTGHATPVPPRPQ